MRSILSCFETKKESVMFFDFVYLYKAVFHHLSHTPGGCVCLLAFSSIYIMDSFCCSCFVHSHPSKSLPFFQKGPFHQHHWCLFMWRARWSDLEKLRSQCWHLNGFTPVCFRWCRVSSSDLANRHSQPSHEHR